MRSGTACFGFCNVSRFDCGSDLLGIAIYLYAHLFQIPVFYKEKKLDCDFKCDFLIEDLIVLELNLYGQITLILTLMEQHLHLF
jgi:hypothetical protein